MVQSFKRYELSSHAIPRQRWVVSGHCYRQPPFLGRKKQRKREKKNNNNKKKGRIGHKAQIKNLSVYILVCLLSKLIKTHNLKFW